MKSAEFNEENVIEKIKKEENDRIFCI